MPAIPRQSSSVRKAAVPVPMCARALTLYVLAMVTLVVLGDAAGALAFTATCDPANPTGNTANVLCKPGTTSVCNATSVTVKENIDVTTGGCDFDLGGRTLSFQKTFQMVGGLNGYISVTNAGDITITSTGKLKSRGDFVEPDMIIISGGRITLNSSGVIALIGGALIDVNGDPAGTITLLADGVNASNVGINLANNSTLSGIGQSSFVDAGDRFTDGGTVVLTAKGGSIFDSADITLAGANQGQGGEVDMTAARDITIAKAIDAHGGGGDGGTIDFTAGDNILVSKVIDVSSNLGGGFGGDLSLAAGEDQVGVPTGAFQGGTIKIDAANGGVLKSNGSDAETTGGDGGDIELTANALPPACQAGVNQGALCTVNSQCPGSTCGAGNSVAINVTSDTGVAIQCNGGSMFDGGGGTIFIDSGDFEPNILGPLDGDIVIAAGIGVSGGANFGDGGTLDISAGKNLTISGDITMTGNDGGGDLSGDSGGTTSLNGIIDVHASASTGEAGSVDFISGLAKGGAAGALTLSKNVIATAGPTNGGSETLSFAGCTVSVTGNVKVDGTGGTSPTNIPGGADIEFTAIGLMQLASGSQYLALPGGSITLTHPPGQIPQKTGATFNPPATDNVVAIGSAIYPNCPVCGDGIRQLGEVCDKGAAADGACCNSTCTAFLCATPTVTATPTATRTRTATPTPTLVVATATRTATPTPTLTATPTAVLTATTTPAPGATTSTSTPVLTATATVTSTPTSTATLTASATPTRTATSTPTTTSGATGTAGTPTPSATATNTAAAPTATATPTQTATATPTRTATVTAVPTVTATPTPTVTTTSAPSATATATATGTVGPTSTATATRTPTPTPSIDLSATPTRSATTATATRTATPTPSVDPSVTPTRTATPSPTRTATPVVPTPSPTVTQTSTGPPAPTPTPQSDPLTAKAANKCQKAISRAGSVYAAKRLASLDHCANAVLKCVQEKPTDPACLPAATITCNDEMIGTFATLQSTFHDALMSKCEDAGLTVADLLDASELGFASVAPQCVNVFGTPLADIDAVATCVLAQHECEVQQLFEVQEPRAGEMFDLARTSGATFAAPTCLTDHGSAGGTGDPKTVGKAVDKCEAQAKSSASKFAIARLRGLTACAGAILTCDLTKPGDGSCLDKASGTCAKSLAKTNDEQATKVTLAVEKRCGSTAINYATVRAPTGANLDALATQCTALGVSALDSSADYESCLIRQQICGAEELMRFEVGRAEELLGMASPPLALHSSFCPAP